MVTKYCILGYWAMSCMCFKNQNRWFFFKSGIDLRRILSPHILIIYLRILSHAYTIDFWSESWKYFQACFWNNKIQLLYENHRYIRVNFRRLWSYFNCLVHSASLSGIKIEILKIFKKSRFKEIFKQSL